MKGGDWAVCFLNRSLKPVKVQFDWKNTKVYDDFSKRDLNASAIVYKIKDLWSKSQGMTTKTAFAAEVPAHDVIMLRLMK